MEFSAFHKLFFSMRAKIYLWWSKMKSIKTGFSECFDGTWQTLLDRMPWNSAATALVFRVGFTGFSSPQNVKTNSSSKAILHYYLERRQQTKTIIINIQFFFAQKKTKRTGAASTQHAGNTLSSLLCRITKRKKNFIEKHFSPLITHEWKCRHTHAAREKQFSTIIFIKLQSINLTEWRHHASPRKNWRLHGLLLIDRPCYQHWNNVSRQG